MNVLAPPLPSLSPYYIMSSMYTLLSIVTLTKCPFSVLSFFSPSLTDIGRRDPVMQDIMKRSETIIENEDYVQAKQPLVYMQVLDRIQDASRSCLLYSEVVGFAKVLLLFSHLD